MEINTVIEIQAFGDFDIKYTVCIMVHSEKIDKGYLLKEFYKIQGILSNQGLSNETLSTINDDFIAFLELKGFRMLETEMIYFCD